MLSNPLKESPQWPLWRSRWPFGGALWSTTWSIVEQPGDLESSFSICSDLVSKRCLSSRNKKLSRLQFSRMYYWCNYRMQSIGNQFSKRRREKSQVFFCHTIRQVQDTFCLCVGFDALHLGSVCTQLWYQDGYSRPINHQSLFLNCLRTFASSSRKAFSKEMQ